MLIIKNATYNDAEGYHDVKTLIRNEINVIMKKKAGTMTLTYNMSCLCHHRRCL